MEDESHETHHNKKLNGIDLNGGWFHDELNDLREEGIDAEMTMGSLRRTKSANKNRDVIVEEGIESHQRTRPMMAQRKLESDLMGNFAKDERCSRI